LVELTDRVEAFGVAGEDLAGVGADSKLDQEVLEEMGIARTDDIVSEVPAMQAFAGMSPEARVSLEESGGKFGAEAAVTPKLEGNAEHHSPRAGATRGP
jgi:hypothetical protein